jgi:hypothetical protein
MKGLILECRPLLLSHWRTNAWESPTVYDVMFDSGIVRCY